MSQITMAWASTEITVNNKPQSALYYFSVVTGLGFRKRLLHQGLKLDSRFDPVFTYFVPSPREIKWWKQDGRIHVTCIQQAKTVYIGEDAEKHTLLLGLSIVRTTWESTSAIHFKVEDAYIHHPVISLSCKLFCHSLQYYGAVRMK